MKDIILRYRALLTALNNDIFIVNKTMNMLDSTNAIEIKNKVASGLSKVKGSLHLIVEESEKVISKGKL